jgi:hypothetical protein
VAWNATQVHPADLDGSSQLNAIALTGDSEARLPFAVDEAFLRGVATRAAWAIVALHGTDKSFVGMTDAEGRTCARLDGFIARARKSTPRVSKERRWHYELEWSSVLDDAPRATNNLNLLVVGHTPGSFQSSHGYTITQDNGLVKGGTGVESWHAIVFTASLWPGAGACVTELRVVDTALRLLQRHAMLKTAPPVWFCMARTQPVSHEQVHTNAGLWGLARACRSEHMALPASCIDMQVGTTASASVTMMHQHTLRLSSGCVRGLNMSASVEPEAACAGSLLVPRLVAPYDTQPTSLDVEFAAVCHLLDAHTSNAMAALDMGQLRVAYKLLETLCQAYISDAMRGVPTASVPVWHHKLLYSWCAKQSSTLADQTVAPADVRNAYSDLWAETQLAESTGPRFADALASVVAYQELLFPGGSMDAVLPVYETAVVAVFFNDCIVAATKAILASLNELRAVVVLEVGAGTGGTASSLLPVVDACVSATYSLTCQRSS